MKSVACYKYVAKVPRLKLR